MNAKTWDQVKLDQQGRRIVELATVVWIVMSRTDTYYAEDHPDETLAKGVWHTGEEVAVRWFLRQRDAELEVTSLRNQVGDVIAQRRRQQGKRTQHQIVYMLREATYGTVLDLSNALELADQMIEEWCERRERLRALEAEYTPETLKRSK